MMRHKTSKVRSLVVALLIVGSFWEGPLLSPRGASRVPSSVRSSAKTPAATPARTRVGENLPLSFERNFGQTDEAVDFLARGPGYTLFLAGAEATLVLQQREERAPSGRTPAGRSGSRTRASGSPTGVHVTLAGRAARVSAVGLDELPGRINYFLGSDPKRWRTGIPTYATVKYTNVYPGVDLVYYGHQGQLEYDFIVAPGAHPEAIAMRMEGATRLELESDGDILATVAGGSLRMKKPIVYQEVAGQRRLISARYVVTGADRVAFEIGRYDRTRPLIIDPVVLYSTYLGGRLGEIGTGLAVDLVGNMYLAGITTSPDFPLSRAIQATAGGDSDVFVARLNPAGTGLVYASYLGGSNADEATGLAIDSFGNAFLTGVTASANFPTARALQAVFGGETDAFIAALSPGGSAFIYSTYLGGTREDVASDIAVDTLGNVYVTGATRSVNFPTTVGAFDRGCGTDVLCNGGALDAFVTKLNPRGSALLYSTFLGGSGVDVGTGIAVSGGNAHVVGFTESADFPTQRPFQATSRGGREVFVTKLNSFGSGLLYSSFLGGTGNDVAARVAVDGLGNAHVVGTTDSSDFPTAVPVQATRGGDEDAFVTKVNATGTRLIYSTYLGGSNADRGADVVVDLTGVAHVVGTTQSADFPTAHPLQAALNGSSDVFVVRIGGPQGLALTFSTFLGGSGEEIGFRVATDVSGNTYVTGATSSTDFPAVNPLRPTNGGGADAFVTKIGEPIPTPPPAGSH